MGKISLLRFLYLVTLLSLACFVYLACTPLQLPGAEKTAVPVPSSPFSSASPIPARASPSPTPNPLNEIVAPLKSQDLEGLHYAGPFLLERLNQPVQILFRNWNYPENSYPASLFEFSSSHPDEIAVNALGQVTALKDAGQSRITVKAKGQNWKDEYLLSVNQLDSDGSRYQTWRVNQETYIYQRDSQIAMDGQGNFLIVWSQYVQNPDNSLESYHYQIMGQRYDSQGKPLGLAFNIGETSIYSEGQNHASLAMQKNGDFVVVWTYKYDKLWGQTFDKSGQAKGSPFLISETTSMLASMSDGNKASVAMAENGDFAVSWTGFSGVQGAESHAYYRLYSATGQPKVPEMKTPFQDAIHPQIAMDARGNFVLVTKYLSAILFDAAGRARSSVFKINATPFVKTDELPAISMNASGEWVVAWTSYLETNSSRLFNSDSTRLVKVFARKFNAKGEPLGPELGVSGSGYFSNFSSPNLGLDLNDSGRFSVLWCEFINDSNDFWIRSYSPDLIPQIPEIHFLFHSGVMYPHPRLVLSEDGEAVMTWESRRDSLDIFARRIQLISNSSKN